MEDLGIQMGIAKATLNFPKIVQVFEFLGPMAEWILRQGVHYWNEFPQDNFR